MKRLFIVLLLAVFACGDPAPPKVEKQAVIIDHQYNIVFGHKTLFELVEQPGKRFAREGWFGTAGDTIIIETRR